MPDEDVRLYGITGLFEVKDNGNFCFGGYFKHDHVSGAIFDGELVDYYGRSRINGHMFDERLVFSKSYPLHKVDYEFRLRDNGLWLGEWNRPKRKQHGKAGCVVHDCGFVGEDLAKALSSRQGTMTFDVDAWADFIRIARQGHIYKVLL